MKDSDFEKFRSVSAVVDSFIGTSNYMFWNGDKLIDVSLIPDDNINREESGEQRKAQERYNQNVYFLLKCLPWLSWPHVIYIGISPEKSQSVPTPGRLLFDSQ